MKIYVAVMCTFDYYEFNSNLFVSNDIQKVYKYIDNNYKDIEVVLISDDNKRTELEESETTFIEIEEWEIEL